MGYRSNVTYIVTFNCVDQPEKAYAQFTHFYEWVTKKHKIEEESGHYDYERHRTLGCGKFYWNVDEMTLVFEAKDIKWYPNFVEVEWDEQLLGEVWNYSCGAYKFIRVGEEHDDIHHKDYTGDDVDKYFGIDLYTETRIVCDLPNEKDFTKETS